MPLTRVLGRTPAPRLAARFARLELAALARRLARALGVNRPPVLTLDDLPVPDSRIAREATALVERIASPLIVNHSLRTYLFGAAVGRHLGWRPDHELLYLASVLHDLGLVPDHDGPGCFELNGARAARTFLVEAGLPAARADRVHEAIALHSAVGIAGSREPEIALVHFGAGVDVIGYRAEDVAPQTRAAIVARHPRLDFKRDFAALVLDQAARKPDCHIAGHVGLGFARKIAAAPFAD